MIKQKGQTLIELLLVIGMMSIFLPALLTGLVASRSGKAQQSQRLQATALLNETKEIVRSVREKDWTNIPVAGTYHTDTSGSLWTLSNGSVSNNGFTQQVVIADVMRDGNGTGNIVESGGIIDPSTKKIDITISWDKPYASTMNSTMYLTRYKDNFTYGQTTEGDFDTAISKPGLTVTNNFGGEIQLTNNNKAKWCSPALSSATIDLPDGPPVAVDAMANPVSTSIPNDVFVAVAPNTSTSIKMAYLTVSADTDPPVPTLKGTFTLDPGKFSSSSLVPTGIALDNNFKTNDIKYYKSPAGKTYALIATNLPDKEIIAVQINDGSGDAFQDSANKIYKYWTFFNTKIYGSYLSPTSTPTPTPRPTSTPTIIPTPTPSITQSSTLYPTGNGSYTAWTNNYTAVDETGTPSCSSSDSIISATNNQRESFTINLSSIPNGSTITSLDVTAGDRGDTSAGGNYKMFIRFNGIDIDDSVTLTAAGSSGSACNLHTRTFDVTNTVKGSGTSLEIGVLKTGTSSPASNGVRVGVMRTVVTYIPPITNTPTPSRTPTPQPTPTSVPQAGSNDQAPFGYGAVALTILNNRGYVASGGYLYVFDLSNIDSKSAGNGLDEIGCRIQLDGYDCLPGSGTDRKYNAGETGTSWSDTTGPAHNDCSDGGNVELYADHQLSAVQVGSNTYIYVAVGAGTNPELNIINVTSVPGSGTSPAINNNSCGRASGGNSGWRRIGSLDFNESTGEEAANSVYAKTDGTRAYISSNGGIMHSGIPDSNQFYIIDTTDKTNPRFLSTWPSTTSTHYRNTAQSGFYNGDATNIELYPRRALTVLNGLRAILVGQDGIPSNGIEPKEYQVINIDPADPSGNREVAPLYCGGVNFLPGYNDLTSVSEADGDNFVYMVANTMEKQLKIIQGGPDNGIYTDQGTYESATFDAGHNVTFNHFATTTTLPANSSLKFQFAVADAVSGSCNGVIFNYAGPDGSSGSYYPATGGPIYMDHDNIGYENPGRCFRYKAFFSTTDFSVTPILQDITINYSP